MSRSPQQLSPPLPFPFPRKETEIGRSRKEVAVPRQAPKLHVSTLRVRIRRSGHGAPTRGAPTEPIAIAILTSTSIPRARTPLRTTSTNGPTLRLSSPVPRGGRVNRGTERESPLPFLTSPRRRRTRSRLPNSDRQRARTRTGTLSVLRDRCRGFRGGHGSSTKHGKGHRGRGRGWRSGDGHGASSHGPCNRTVTGQIPTRTWMGGRSRSGGSRGRRPLRREILLLPLFLLLELPPLRLRPHTTHITRQKSGTILTPTPSSKGVGVTDKGGHEYVALLAPHPRTHSLHDDVTLTNPQRTEKTEHLA